MSTLQDFSNAIAGVVSQASKFVVTVHAGTRFASTGVVWQPGVVVTTDHTVRQEEDLRITLPNGSTISAALVGRDPGTDLAILRFEGESEVRPASPATAEPGHIALAIGQLGRYRTERRVRRSERGWQAVANLARRSDR